MLKRALSFLYNDFKARAVMYYRTKQVVNSLQRVHQRELDEAPVNLRPMIQDKHSLEIQAAQSGRWPITDRKTWAFPYLPESLHRLHMPILKSTPYNLRRFSETPIPRRCIKLIKDTILSLRWKIEVVDGKEKTPDREKRIRIATTFLKHPNKVDSFKTFAEAVLEDFLVTGAGTIEPAITPSYTRPIKLWSVDSSTIRIFADWTESQPDKPKYAQMTGLKGERGFVTFRDDELIYIRDNVRTSTPFGLGCLEVAFNSVNALLGVQDMATRAGSDQVHKTFLWWRSALSRSHFEQVRRYIRNEGEGQAKISMVSGIEKPDEVEVQPVTQDDLLIPWQELLIRQVAVAFGMSPQSVGLEGSVNRATAEVMDMKDFRSAIVPPASTFQEAMTRFVLHNQLDWHDLEFKFIGLEDPDILTKAKLHQILYQLDAETSNHIAEEFGLPMIEGGWGDLTFMQKQVMIAKAQALLGIQGQKQMMGMQQDMQQKQLVQQNQMQQDQQMNNPEYDPWSTGGPMNGSVFSAKEIAGMQPDQVEKLRQNGMVPKKAQDIKDSMEENQPGILDQLSDEMMEYFEFIEKQEQKEQVEPAKVTSADEKNQLKMWRKNDKDRKPQFTDRKSKIQVRPSEYQNSDRRFQ